MDAAVELARSVKLWLQSVLAIGIFALVVLAIGMLAVALVSASLSGAYHAALLLRELLRLVVSGLDRALPVW